MYLFRYPLIIVFLLAFLPVRSFGWNDTGHEIIASIIYDEMTPAARTAAVDLLKQHPRYDKDLLDKLPARFDADRYAFMIAATWPDIVRSPKHPMHFVANHPVWHYIDIPYIPKPYDAPKPHPQADAASATQPAGPSNVLEALDKATADVHNPALSPQDRAIALCWVIHLAEDLHQPLHAAGLFSPQYPEGDHGGNLQLVLRTANQPYSQLNLHALWDQMLGIYRSPQMVVRMAEGLHHDPQFSRDKLAGQIGVHDFAAWAKESHELAVTDVYLNGKLQTLSQAAATADPKATVPHVPADYIEHGEEICARRAMLAGYRTADLLDTLLAEK